MNHVNTNKLSYLYIPLVAISLYTLLQSFIGHTAIFIVIGSLLWVAVNQNFMRSGGIISFFLFAAVVFLQVLWGNERFDSWQFTLLYMASILFPASLSNYLFESKDDKLMKGILYTVFCVFILEAIATTIISRHGGISYRNISPELIENYYRWGFTNYILPHAMPFVVPPLIMTIRKRDISTAYRLFFVGLLLSSFLITYYSAAAGAVVTYVVTLLLSLLISPNKTLLLNVRRVFILCLFLAPVILNDNLQLMTLETISSVVPDTNPLYDKIQELMEIVKYGDSSGDLSDRAVLYEQGLSALDDPLVLFLGNAKKGTFGGHSAILNYIATLGLIGTIPLFLFIAKQIKYSYNIIKEVSIGSELSYYVVSLISAFLMLAGKAVIGFEIWFLLFTVTPLMFVVSIERK